MNANNTQKKAAYFYMTWLPSDSSDLSWFAVHSTRKAAMDDARNSALNFGDGWKVKYLSAKSGGDPDDYNGRETVVVQQTSYHYHGA
tara:strand:- start:13 stop:273 length:261 start_codon:yes stop_codon:yes gene_type:complete